MVWSIGQDPWSPHRERPNVAESRCSESGTHVAVAKADLAAVAPFGTEYLDRRERLKIGESRGLLSASERSARAGAMAEMWRYLTRSQRVVMARLIAAQDADLAARGIEAAQ